MSGTPGVVDRGELSTGVSEEDTSASRSRRVADWGASGVITALLFVAMGQPPPAGNEWIYLPLLRKSADAAYLPGDWTFGSGFQEKAVFNAVFGPLLDVVGDDGLVWLGRLAFWLILARLLVALGRRLGCTPWMTVGAVFVLMGIDWSMGVGETGPVSRFEASAVGKVLVFGGLVAALDRRIPLAAILIGLAFTFHTAVGLWGGAVLVGLLVVRATRIQTLRWLPAAALFALPGLIVQVESLLNSSMDSASAEFVALSRIPHHVDPLSFGERGPLILVLMLAFNLLWAWRERDRYEFRLLGVLQGFLLLVAIGGVVARVLGSHEFLLLQPYRILPFLAPLLFLLTIGSLVTASPRVWLRETWSNGYPGRAMLASGFLAILAVIVLWNPVVHWVDGVDESVDSWRGPEDDLDIALMWLATNTPSDAVIASPPWVDQIFYLSERAQFVSWEGVTYDRPREWRERLELTVADPAVWVEDNHPDSLAVSYEAVPLTQWERVSREYGVSYVVTSADYSRPPLFSSGQWHVYELSMEG
jgi:hypothetical protein